MEFLYREIKEMLLDDYDELIENENYTTEQAIACMTEDSVKIMKYSFTNYVSTIVGLCTIALKENILIDYIYERFLKIETIEPFNYNENDKELIAKDFLYVMGKIKDSSYQLLKDEQYKARVDMLFRMIKY